MVSWFETSCNKNFVPVRIVETSTMKLTILSIHPHNGAHTDDIFEAIPQDFRRRKRDSYLAGRGELQRTKGGLQVLGVALEIEESASDGGLQLGGVLPGGRVEGNLVDGRHDCDGEGGLSECRRRGVISLSRSNWGISCGIGTFA